MSASAEQILSIRDSAARRKAVAILSRIRKCKGRAAALSMHVIAKDTLVSARDIQAIVKALVEEKHLPIGTAFSKPFGYFWIVTDDERRAVRNSLIRRGVSTLEHAHHYDDDQLVGPIVGQLELALRKEEEGRDEPA